MKELFLRTVFGILYVMLILLLVYYNFSPVLFLLFGLLAMSELSRILRFSKNTSRFWSFAFAAGFMPWFLTIFINSFLFESDFFSSYALWMSKIGISDAIVRVFEWRWMAILLILVASIVRFFKPNLWNFLPLAYIILPIALAVEIEILDYDLGISPILYIFVYMWVFDTFSYVFGKLFGRHTIAPSISPGKTWEGFTGGIVGALLLTYLLYLSKILPFSHPFTGYILAVVLSIFAFLGDLFESKLKRRAGLKDSGSFIPGHGGILDRIDSFLFAAPAFYFVYPLLLRL